MKLLLSTLSLFIFISGFLLNEVAQTPTVGLMQDDQVLRHVVLFKFNESTTENDIKTIEDAFSSLPDKIPEIIDFEWGLNNSPEGLDKGFTHCYFITFANEVGRDIYLPNPDYVAFTEIVGPHLEDVLVVDYWTKK